MRSNCKEVKEKIREHIGEYYTKEDLKKEVENLMYKRSIYNAGVAMVEGGCFLIYYEDIRSFLNSLDLNNSKNRSFSDVQCWDMYKYLVSREIEKIVKK